MRVYGGGVGGGVCVVLVAVLFVFYKARRGISPKIGGPAGDRRSPAAVRSRRKAPGHCDWTGNSERRSGADETAEWEALFVVPSVAAKVLSAKVRSRRSSGFAGQA